MKFSLVVFTVLLLFNYQGFSRNAAPTTGAFKLFYPMIHGFLRGVVESETMHNYPAIPAKTYTDFIMGEFNNTLICLNEYLVENVVNKQFESLFANLSDSEPFDIMNSNANLTFVWERFYNMIITAWSITFDCLTSNPFKPQIEKLLLYTSPNIIFEMYNALKVNHSSDANILLQAIISYYLVNDYDNMGYYMYQLVLLGMNDVAYYYLPPYVPASPPIRKTFNIIISIQNRYDTQIVGSVRFIARLLSVSGSSLVTINCRTLNPSRTNVQSSENHTITFPSLVLGIRVQKVELDVKYYNDQNTYISGFLKTFNIP